MSAVAELSPEEVERWVMPRPARGQQVLWFADADRLKEPEIAFVQTVSHRTLTIQIGRQSMDQVRHLNDPKLKINEFQRQNGAWDFPADNKKVFDLEQRVATLEKQLAALMAPAVSKRKPVQDEPSL
jgi:hypothetical protein